MRSVTGTAIRAHLQPAIFTLLALRGELRLDQLCATALRERFGRRDSVTFPRKPPEGNLHIANSRP